MNDKIKTLFILIFSVMFGAIFFQGNGGNFYQYYLTGYYLIFLLLISVFLGKVFILNFIGKILIISFFAFFLYQNWNFIKPYINTTGSETNTIVLTNQKKAIGWVYQNTGSRDFNIDVYVPPVISYSYDYLFKWLGNTKYNKLSSESQVPLLYTLYEVDPEHPERLKAWLDRQSGIGSIIKEQSYGGITVQERTRIIKK